MIAHLVALSLVSSFSVTPTSALVQADLFGANLKAVTQTEANAISGVSVPGVAVIEVTAGGLADEIGMRKGDVIHQVNGSRLRAPRDVESALSPLGDLRSIVFARQHRVISMERSPEVSQGAARVAFVGAEGSELGELLSNAGLVVDYSPGLPSQLGPYAVLVIENNNACTPAIVERLRAYLQKGGGVVLIADQPELLAGDDDLSKISDWFGASRFYFANKSWNDRIQDPQVTLSTSFQGSKLRVGDVIWSRKGDFRLASCSNFSERAIVRAKFVELGEYGGFAGNAAFTHEYGTGRMYWQFKPFDPNYLKLAEQFIAGVKWASQRPNGAQGSRQSAGDDDQMTLTNNSGSIAMLICLTSTLLPEAWGHI